MKKNLFIICCFLIVFCGFSQNNEIDSLKFLLNTQIHDTTKVNLYLLLSKEYHSENLDTTRAYIKKAHKLSIKNNNHKLVNIYTGIGLSHYYNSNIDSARYYYDEALKLLDINDDKIIRATVYSNYSLSYEQTNDNKKRAEYNLKAIDLVKNYDAEVCFMYYNQGTIYYSIDLFDKALKYFELAYLSSEKANVLRVKSAAINALAIMCIDQQKFEKAKTYIDKAIIMCEELKSPEICYFSNNQLGIYYKELQKFDEANKAFLESKKYAKQLNRKHDILASNITLAQNEFERGNYNMSAQYFEEFEKLYKEESNPSIGATAYRDWAKTEAKRKKFKKAYGLLLKHSIIKDSTLLKENKQVIADAEEKYQTQKKDKEIVEQQLQLAQNKTQLQKNKTQYSYMTGAALLLLVTSVLLWFLYQQRQKRKNQEILTLKREHQVQTLESLMEGEEKERFRIAKELHDGVNGDLSAIKFKLSTLLDMNNEVIKEAVAMIDKSYEQVRAISHNLIPPSLEDFELIEALDNYCQKINDNQEINVSFQHLGDTLKLSKKDEINIFRIVQELVSNSIKHAEASEINVQISNQHNSLQITVDDNGKGFDKDNIKGNGIGLENIKSRVEYLKGTVDFSSSNRGTSHIIEIDLDKTV